MGKHFKLPFRKLILFIGASLISAVLSVSLAFIIQVTIDSAGQRDGVKFKRIVLISLIFIVLYAVFCYLKTYYMQKLSNTVTEDLRNRLFEKISSQTYVDYRKRPVSDYLSVLTNDIHTYQDGALRSKLLIIQNSFPMIAAIIALLLTDIKITWLVILSTIIIFFVPAMIRKKINLAQEETTKEISDLTNYCESHLEGFYEVYTYGKQEYVQADFQKRNTIYHKIRMKLEQLIAESETISASLSVATELIILFVSGNLVFTNVITVGAMVAIMQLTGAFVQPLMIIMQNIPRLSGGKALEQRFATILDKPTIAVQKDNTAEIPFNNEITLSKIDFAYSNGEQVLKNINLSFQKGMKYALIGGSGAGKTTLINLINGLYCHYTGNIILDNQIIKKEYSMEYMNLFATVGQNVFLFNTSIIDNIVLSNNVNEQLFKEVCKISGVNEIVEYMQYGYKTKITDKGVNLSGGQKQKIALARALYHKKPVLILDEGTSAIDKVSAQFVEKSLLKINDLTLITITHDVSSPLLTHYDGIIFMENGAVLAAGTYNQLMQNNQSFCHFVKRKTN